MLQITIDQNGKKEIRKFFVIDSHSHMGKDVDGAEMMNPMAPGTGTFDFWTKIESRFENEWKEGKSKKKFRATIDGKPSTLTLDFVQNPVVQGIYKALENRNISGKYSDFHQRIQHQRLVDMAVCFPFQDQFRDRKPEALYRASNTNVHRQTSKFPVSLRMVGYMRCDPMEGQKAVNEVEYWASNPKSNIRGLKLHPRSEGWVDNVTSSKVINVLLKAAEYNFPIIFDTRGKQSILDIGDLIRATRSTIKNKNPDLLQNFKVIIAHAGQGNVGDHEVYRTLTQPNTWMDLSMLHGVGAERFLSTFQRWCNSNGVENRTGRKWSEFCLFATDYPYFGDQHAKELIEYLFNESFFKNGGNLEDSANILGLNQIQLFPEYSKAKKLTFQHQKTVSTFLQNTETLPAGFAKKPSVPKSSTELMYDTLAVLIEENKLEIHSFLPQFQEKWKNWDEEFCLLTSSKIGSNRDLIIPLLFNKIQGDDIGLLGTLPKDVQWKKMGYQYFDPETRNMFHKMFNSTFPAAICEDAAKMIEQAYQ